LAYLLYYEDTKLGLTVGVWTTTSMQEAFGPYPGDEFMHILEGKVAMLDASDNAVNINQGETFLVRNGIPVSWKQDGFCRKFFMTYLSPDKPTPEIDTVDSGIIVLREDELEARFTPSKNDAGASELDAEIFVNDTGNMSAGMWEADAFESGMEPFPFHEFAQILNGNVVITQEAGTQHAFAAGDCLFIAAGTVCSWKCDAPVRKYYCSLSPSNEA